MYKKLIAMMPIMSFLLVLTVVATEPSLYDGFESYSVGHFVNANGWTVVEKADTGGNIIVEGSTNKSLKISVNDVATPTSTPTAYDSYVQTPYYSSAGKFVVNVDLKVLNTMNGNIQVVFRDNSALSAGSTISLVKIDRGEIKFLPDMASGQFNYPAIDSTWYKVTAYIDTAKQTIDVYCDNELKGHVEGIRTVKSGTWSNFNFNSFTTRFQTTLTNKAVGQSINTWIDNVEIFTNNSLESGIVCKDTTMAINYSGQYYSINDLKTGNLKVSEKIINNTPNNKNINIIMAIYNGSILENVSVSQSYIVAQGADTTVEADMNVSNNGGGRKLKVFTLDELGNMKPISTPVIYEKGAYERPIAPQIVNDLKTFSPNNKHPRLLMDSTKLTDIKTNINNNTVVNGWYVKIKAQADAIINQPVAVYDDTDALRLQGAYTVHDRVWALAFAYKISGETKYATRLWTELNAAAAWVDWNQQHFLDISALCSAFALAYDWLYDYWSPSQLQTIRNALVNKGLNVATQAYDNTLPNGYGWWVTADNNWNIVCNGGVAMGALALADEPEYEQLCGNILEHGLISIESSIKNFAPDGAWYEGAGYWNYTLEYLSLYLGSMLSATGRDYSYMSTPGISATGYFPINMTGISSTFNVHDAAEGTISSPELLFLANYFGYKNLGGYRYYQLKNLNMTPEVRDILWYNPLNISLSFANNLEKDKLFGEIEISSFRNNYFGTDTVFAALHGGLNGVNHGQIDIGTFIYEAKGIRWAVDLGGDNYNLYNYFTTNDTAKSRWSYYRNRGEGHNTIILNPSSLADQPLTAKSLITGFKSSQDYGWAIADTLSAYTSCATSAKRGLKLDKITGGVTLQDEIQLNASTNLYWFMHTKATITLSNDKRSAILTQKDSNNVSQRLWVGILSTGGTFEALSATPLSTSPNPNTWPENLDNLGDSNNPKTQNANTGITKLSIHNDAAQGSTTICVYMIPLATGQNAPASTPAIATLANWN